MTIDKHMYGLVQMVFYRLLQVFHVIVATMVPIVMWKHTRIKL